MSLTRKAVAEDIIGNLKNWFPDGKARLRGSVATRTADKFSDIDISLYHDGIPNNEILTRLIFHMEQKYDIIFYDCAKSFLPNECVITFFLSNLPLHWCIETSITVPPNMRTLTGDLIDNKHPDQSLKLWVISGRRVARNPESVPPELDYLCRKLIGNTNISFDSPIGMMRTSLEVLKKDTMQIYPEFFKKCKEFIEQIENGNPGGALKNENR